MNNENEQILKITVRNDDAIRNIAQYRIAIENLRREEAEYKKALKDKQISQEEYNARIVETQKKMMEAKEVVQALTKEVRNNIKIEKEQEGSLISLRAQLSNLTTEYDSLSEAERNAAKGQNLKNRINEITDSLKGAEEETQRFYRNVGNYTEAITKAAEANIPFIQEIHNSETALSGLKGYLSDVKNEFVKIKDGYLEGASAAKTLSGTQKAAAVSTNLLSTAMKILKVALISTGIGAIVVALGSLVAYLTKTQKGVEIVSKAMAALGAAVNVIIDRLAKLGGAIVKLFTGDFTGALSDTKEAFSGIGDEIARETKLAWELQDVLSQIEKQEIMLSMKRAANRAEIEKLKKVSDDTTLSTVERMKAAQKAYELEQEDLKLQTEIAEKRLANTLGYKEMNEEVRKLMEQIKQGSITADELIGKLGLSESTIDDLKEFREQFNSLQELSESSYTRQTEQQNKLNAIRKEGANAAKEARKKEVEAYRKAQDTLIALIQNNAERQREQLKVSYDREIEDLKKKLTDEKNLTSKAKDSIRETIKLKEQQQQKELAKLSNEQYKAEIERRQKLIETQLDAVKAGSEQEYQLKMQQLIAQRDLDLSNTELTEQMKLAIRAKYNKQMDDLVKQHDADLLKKQQDAMKLRYETEIAKVYNNEAEVYRIRLKQRKEELDKIQQMEGESIEAFNLRKLELKNAYLDAEKELANKEIEIETQKAEAIGGLIGGISSLLELAGETNEEMARAAKLLAIAEVAIAQGVAIAKAVETATRSSATWVDMLVAIGTVVAAVTAVMSTAMKSIKSAKFATGGLVTGPGIGTSDSIPAQLSNGESVMTARATELFAPILSSFNQMGGGVPINITASSNQTMGEDMLARAVAKGVQMMPNPVVSVTEINTVGKRVEVLENLGSL